MAGRTIAIGDIHGCRDALAALIDAIQPDSSDTIVTLGDYLDRGPHSRGVVEYLIGLSRRCRLIPLLGNQEEMFLDALRDISTLRKWLTCGGADALRSYGWAPGGPKRALAEWFPELHRIFLASCRPYFETATHLFLHAGYVPELQMEEQSGLALRWRVTDAATTVPHCSGKIAIVGHTRQLSGEVLDMGFLMCIDTNCARDGWLTAIDVGVGRIWQANRDGRLRHTNEDR